MSSCSGVKELRVYILPLSLMVTCKRTIVWFYCRSAAFSDVVWYVFTPYMCVRTTNSLSSAICLEGTETWKNFTQESLEVHEKVFPANTKTAHWHLNRVTEQHVSLAWIGRIASVWRRYRYFQQSSSESAHIDICNVKGPCRAGMKQNMMHLLQFHCLFSSKSSEMCSVSSFICF